MRRVAGLIAYDGTDFCGFQVQRREPTIQGALEEALAHLTGAFCRISGAGRTDTGVHARGQVIVVELPWKHSLTALRHAWNQHLPASIVVRCLTEAVPGFTRASVRRSGHIVTPCGRRGLTDMARNGFLYWIVLR